jgi:outer membrane protein assembly factor BamB
MRLRAFVVIVAAVVCSGVEAIAGDWPSWRGPNRDDISTETGLLKSWPEGGPAKLWTSKDAGLGYSGFSIVGDVLFTMGADGATAESKEFVVAINAKTGEKLWQSNIGPFLENGWGGGPRSTPSVAEGLVVAIGGKGDVVCLNAADGAEKWRVSLTELGGVIPSWGFCESALIDGENVVVTPGGPQGTVACFKLATGEKVWQSADITENAHYSSIIAVDHFGKRQFIQLTETKVFGLNVVDGKLLWKQDFPGRVAVIPTPIYKDGAVYVTAGYGAGCMLVNVTADNKVEKIYENKVMKNHHGGVVLIGEFVYGHSDATGLVCQNLITGEQVWSDDKKNGSKGAVAYADGMLYCLEEGSGDCFLVEATSAGYKEVSRFKLDPQTTQRNPQGRIWTHPVIANGKLYLRDQEILCCYDITAK